MRFQITSLLALLLFCGCNRWTVPNEYLGHWKSDKTKITVRTEPQLMKFEFVSDSADVSIEIGANKQVTGRIGDATFVSGVLKKNWGLPSSITGISYIVECGTIGSIYSKDPLKSKHVELWLSPIKMQGSMEAELRFTDKQAQFPMAGVVFKQNKP